MACTRGRDVLPHQGRMHTRKTSSARHSTQRNYTVRSPDSATPTALKGPDAFFPFNEKTSNSRTGVFCLLHSLAFVLVRGCCASYLTTCRTPRFTPHTYTCVSPHSVTHTKPRARQGSSRGRSGGGPEPLPRSVYSACCTDPRASRLGWDGWMRFPSLWCLCVLRDVTTLPGTSGKCVSAQGRKP